MNNLRWLFIILFILAALLSCSLNRPLAPVQDRAAPPSTKVLYYEVSPGDTLYSIAWRYNLDYKRLAEVNGIDDSYRIVPGQRIYLDTSKRRPASIAQAKPKQKARPYLKPLPPSSKNNPPRLKNKTKQQLPAAKKAVALSWRWPAKGPLVGRFRGNGGFNKGIDIGGKLRDSVIAAAPGTVVYSGEGIRGYGKLIIIKHSQKYLSAYAHLNEIRIREGDTVLRNQKIGEIGRSGTTSVKLHFEIRYDGKPVDPLKYLPTKR